MHKYTQNFMHRVKCTDAKTVICKKENFTSRSSWHYFVSVCFIKNSQTTVQLTNLPIVSASKSKLEAQVRMYVKRRERGRYAERERERERGGQRER